jgi:hypothetical protein
LTFPDRLNVWRFTHISSFYFDHLAKIGSHQMREGGWSHRIKWTEVIECFRDDSPGRFTETASSFRKFEWRILSPTST